MSETLLEIVKPIIEPVIAERGRMIEIQVRKETKEEVEKVKEEGIKSSVFLLRSLGHNDDVIKTAIMEQYHLSEEETNRYL